MLAASDSFWEIEAHCPLLGRNANFLNPLSADKLIKRAKNFLNLIENHVKGDLTLDFGDTSCKDEAVLRVFEVDAERTYKDSRNREEMIATLKLIWLETKDYHQGMGFICAFLLLFLDQVEVAKVIIGLHRHYLQGYFKAAARKYVRDARVMGKLFKKHYPAVNNTIAPSVPPEAFCSKWFIGLNIHVLPFEALFDFFENFLANGFQYLFQFALSLVKNCEEKLLEATDLSVTLAILRLDTSVYPDTSKAPGSTQEGSFFVKLVEDALEFEIDQMEIEQLRLDVENEMDKEDEIRAKQVLEESDDEIVFSDE